MGRGFGARLEALTRRPFGWPVTVFYESVASPAVARIVTPVLLEALETAPSGTVADIGCGAGTITANLQREGHPVIGVEPSLPQLRRMKANTGLACVAAGAEAVPLRSATCAAVVSSCAVKHWRSRSAGIAECARLLQPGGRLVVVEIDGGIDDRELLRFAAQARIPLGMHRAYRAFARRTFVPASPSADEIAADFTAAGLRDVRRSRVESLPFLVVTGER